MGMIPSMEEAAPAPESFAGGLNGPMGVLVDPDGNVWVIDSGLGGEAEIDMINPETGEEMVVLTGDTARIVQITPDGSQTNVATLPSLLIEDETVGGSRLAYLDGEIYATSGNWVGSSDIEPAPLMAAIVKVSDGNVVEVANIWDLEVSENPGGFGLDSNPFGLTVGPDGNLWIADAGANALMHVDPSSGEINVITTFDGLPGPFENPFRDLAMEIDPVPTAVAFDDDLNVFVSFLTGFPFPPGGAKVVMISPDGTISDYATGLTMLTDLRVGPDGEMYAVQFGQFTEQGPIPASGAIVRVGEGDSSALLLDGLSFPTSIDFNAAGDAYITINGVGPPGSGEVVIVTGLTGVAGTPITAMAEEAPTEVPMLPETAMGPEIPQDKGYLIEDMGDGLYVVSDGLYQMMFLTTGEGVIVVDAPPNMGQNILAAIAEVTDEPITHVVYSHAHADHIGSAGIFPADATYIAHAATAETLAQNGADDSAREMPFAMFVGGGPVPIPTETFEDSYTLEVGNQVLELDYLGPNHAPGNIFIYAPDHGVLMLVDIIYPGWTPFKDLGLAQDIPGYLTAHEQALDYDFDSFVGGHVTRVGTGEDVQTQIAYIQDIRANAVQALQTVDFMAVAQEVNFGYGDFWVLFDAYLGAVAQTCADLTLEEWGGQLGGVETVTESHCFKMMDSLRLD